MTTTGWPALRQQARQFEVQTETLLQSYSQLASLSNIPPKPTDQEQKIEQQLNDVLKQRESIIASLGRLLDSEAQPSALKSSHLARHRETLQRHRTDLNRLKSQISTVRDRANLLSSVRSDISAYRAANADPGNAEADYMLDERARLDNSHNMTDSVLSQAYAVNENFGTQRDQLERIRRRVTGVVGQVPGINTLIGKIGTKKRRDGIILGSFIAVCCLLLLYFL